MSNKKFRDQLFALGACSEAVKWVGDRDLATAWAECERGDWMMWWLNKTAPDKRLSVTLAVEFAERVVHLAKSPDAKLALDAARAWLDGTAAAPASAFVYDAAAAIAFAYSASAVDAYASSSAYASAYASAADTSTGDAATSAYTAAGDAATARGYTSTPYVVAFTSERRAQASIIRLHVPTAPELKL